MCVRAHACVLSVYRVCVCMCACMHVGACMSHSSLIIVMIYGNWCQGLHKSFGLVKNAKNRKQFGNTGC